MWTIDSCPGLYPVWPTSHSHVTPTLQRKQSLSLYEVPTHTTSRRVPNSSLPALMTQKNCFLLFFFFFNSLLFFSLLFSSFRFFYELYIFFLFFFVWWCWEVRMGWVTDRAIFFQSALYNTEQTNHFRFSKSKKKKKLTVFSLFRLRLNRAKTKNSKSVKFFFFSKEKKEKQLSNNRV
jgi:hypothetical protein